MRYFLVWIVAMSSQGKLLQTHFSVPFDLERGKVNYVKGPENLDLSEYE